MRADIHNDPELNRSKQRPNTLMQDRICRIDENLLQHTAGPYIRVKMRRTQCEQIESVMPLYPDLDGASGCFAEGPLADSCTAANGLSQRSSIRSLLAA